MKLVLFAWVHNAGRSQMAAAWFNALADPKEAQAISAGTQPAAQVHPEVLVAMKEVGIDLSGAQPQFLDDELARRSNLFITMGCGEACPSTCPNETCFAPNASVELGWMDIYLSG